MLPPPKCLSLSLSTGQLRVELGRAPPAVHPNGWSLRANRCQSTNSFLVVDVFGIGQRVEIMTLFWGVYCRVRQSSTCLRNLNRWIHCHHQTVLYAASVWYPRRMSCLLTSSSYKFYCLLRNLKY